MEPEITNTAMGFAITITARPGSGQPQIGTLAA
jgi:hypothetical protein